jgi:putative endonuclease
MSPNKVIKKSSNNRTGAFGEQSTVDYLSARGYEILDRNWRIREGEVDIVALSPQGMFSFIEVKTRTSVAFGHPFEAINREKAHRMQRLALAWLATHGCLGCDFSIDVSAVLISTDGNFTIEYRAGVL